MSQTRLDLFKDDARRLIKKARKDGVRAAEMLDALDEVLSEIAFENIDPAKRHIDPTRPT